MSAGSARIVLDALAAWQARDPERVAELLAPGAEPPWARLERDFEGISFQPDETHQDGGSVAVVGRLRARERQGGKGIETRIGWQFVVQDGRIAAGSAHSDPVEALGAAGLNETTARDVALVRRHYAAFNRDDIGGIAATLHPDVEILGRDERGGGALELYRGLEEAAAFFAEIKEAVAENEVTILSLDARPGRVEASVRLSGTIRGTERSGSLPAVHFFVMRDDLIARIETYRPEWRGYR